MKSFMLAVAGLIIAIGMPILVLINGWGLEPKSWGWIIGASFFGQVLAQLFIEAAKSD